MNFHVLKKKKNKKNTPQNLCYEPTICIALTINALDKKID